MRKYIFGAGIMVLATIAFSSSTLALSPVAPFPDVSLSTTPYQEGIKYLQNKNIINGYSDGTYKPTNTLNRAELLKIVAESRVKLDGQDPATFFATYENRSHFNDVPVNAWFNKYVGYGKEKGWIVGYEGGLYFRPEQIVTTMEGLKISLAGMQVPFTESSGLMPWYKGVVDAASTKNYIPLTIRSFDRGLQRDEMADLIARILNDREQKLSMYLGERQMAVVDYNLIDKGVFKNNFVNPLSAKVGDKVGNLTIKNIKSVSGKSSIGEYDAIIDFEGEMELTGTYEYHPDGMLPGISFYVADNYKSVVPNTSIDRTVFFGFKNLDTAKKELEVSTSKPSGYALIKVKDFSLVSFEGEAENTATLVSVSFSGTTPEPSPEPTI